MSTETTFAAAEHFILAHRPHGYLTGDADEPSGTSFRVRLTCSCGSSFGRVVTSGEAELDLPGHGAAAVGSSTEGGILWS